MPNIGATAIGCGTVSAVSPSTIHYTLGTISANTPSTNSPCNFEINITTSTAGDFTNTTTAITSEEGGTGDTSSAVLSVGNPPTIAKGFGAATVGLNQNVSLTFTISNPNAGGTASGLGFNESFPSGLVVATPNGLNNTCGGTVTATAGTGSVQLSGGSLEASSSCSVVVNLTATTAGTKNNSVQVTTTNLGNGNTSNASINVLSAPPITKSFGAATVALNQSVSLTLAISNPNAGSTASGLGFNDSLPSGLVVATPNGLNNTCGGTVTATAGTGSVQLSGGSLGASSSCSVVVNLTATTAGTKNNSVQVATINLGNGNTSTASVNALSAPTLTAAFGAESVLLNGTTSPSFTISNPNAENALSGISLNDILPSGLVVATPNGQTGICLTAASQVTAAGSLIATQGSGSVNISGLGLTSSGSCSFTVNVTGTTAGAKTNTTGNISSTNGGSGNTATSSLTVGSSPTIPTLSEWGMLILALGLVFVASRTRAEWREV